MKLKSLTLKIQAIVCAALLTCSIPSFANSLTTTFAGGNRQNGNMFDVVTNGSAIDINQMTFNLNNGGGNFEIYTLPGSFTSNPDSSAGWTLVYSGLLNAPAIISGLNIFLAANSTTGFYTTLTDAGQYLSYTDGSNSYSNADLSINAGNGKAYAFGADFSPREWNGTIDYNTVSPVPEPSSLVLLTTGLLGACGVVRRRITRS